MNGKNYNTGKAGLKTNGPPNEYVDTCSTL